MTITELRTTFDKFLSDNNGKYVERVDPTNAFQCFDLVIYWCEYLGLPKNIFAGLLNAYQIYTDFNSPFFDKIANSPTNVPYKGDIVVWGKAYNGSAGHTGVATGVANVDTFECFEQNDPTGTNSHLRTYNYNNVLGWLSYKTTAQPIIPPNVIDKSSRYDKLVNYYYSIKALQTDNADLVSFETMKEKFDYERNEKIRLTPKAVIEDKIRNEYGVPDEKATFEQINSAIKAHYAGSDPLLAEKLKSCQTSQGTLQAKLLQVKQSIVNLGNTI